MGLTQRGNIIRAVPVVWLTLLTAASSNDVGTTTAAASLPTAATAQPAPPTTTTAANTTTTTLPPTHLYGGEVVIGTTAEPATLNPYLPGGDAPILGRIGRAVWTGVYDIDPSTLELIPDVVTELPSVANGGITVDEAGIETIRYQIRDEAVWADGVPISGDDFLFTYQTIMDPGLPIDKTLYEDIVPESVVAGPKTFEYALAPPSVEAELLFDTILPRHDVEGSDLLGAWSDRMWVSGGPFSFAEWRPGESITLVRNDNYWKADPETGQQLPILEEATFLFYPDTEAMLAAFADRWVDIILPPAEVATIQQLRSLEGTRVDVAGGPVWEHLAFQFGENRLIRNPGSYNEFVEYRKAIAHAIDRQRIVDEMLGGLVEPLQSYVDVFGPTLSGRAWSRYDYDPEKARDFIEQLCAREDTNCETDPPTAVFTTVSDGDRVSLAQLLEPMLADAGIEFAPDLEDDALFFGETFFFGTWDMAEWGVRSRPGLPGLSEFHDFLDPRAPPPEGNNYYRWGTPEVVGQVPPELDQARSSVIDEATERFARLWDLAQAEVDRDRLVRLIAEMEQILADNVVIIPLYPRLNPAAVWADEIGGYRHSPVPGGDTWNIEQWFRVDRNGERAG